MSVVMRIRGRASGEPTPLEGQFAREFDPDAYGGRGLLDTTGDIAKARRFADFREAYDFWSLTSGTRPDGKPNRPLTAFNIEVAEVE